MSEQQPLSEQRTPGSQQTRWRELCGGVLLLLVVGWLARYMMLEASKPNPYSVIGVPVHGVDEFTAGELASRWQRDSKSLLSQLQNRRILVTGTVADLFKNREEDYLRAGLSISSKASTDGSPLFCSFDDSEPWLLAQPGQAVSVRGCFACDREFELSQCEIVSFSGEPCPELTSQNLPRYRQQPPPLGWVRVSGAINVIQPQINLERSPAIIEVTAADLQVKCRYQLFGDRNPLPGERGRVMEFLGQLSPDEGVDLIHCVRLDDPTDDETDPMAGQEPIPAFQVTPAALHAAWDASRTAANPYDGNWLEIKGTVVNLGRPVSVKLSTSSFDNATPRRKPSRYDGATFLSIGEEGAKAVSCYFSEPEPWLKARPGQLVRIVGLLRHPAELWHCRVVEVSGESGREFSPDEMVKIFLAGKADEELPTNYATVRGTIDEIIPGEPGSPDTLVSLKTTFDDLVVVCHFNEGHPRMPTQDEIGKEIVVFGECLGRTIKLLGRVMIIKPIRLDSEKTEGETVE